MAKSKTVFFCKECGYESGKWMGQCPGCHEWNTMVEEPNGGKKGKLSPAGAHVGITAVKPSRLSEVSLTEETRMDSGIGELNRVLGGGVVSDSLVLVGGDPGIGKSTLLLQMCQSMAAQGRRILYISGEESVKQIKMRAERLGEFKEELYLLSETNMELIEGAIEEIKPELVIIDSIQTMFLESAGTAPGSVSQVREVTASLLRIGKGAGIAIFIVGHVTKEGVVAGPRVLEHMVDTVLYFEGDRMAVYRILRAVKNRFGSTNEIGVFEMKSDGLKEVMNPSEYMLNGQPQGEPGSIVTCSMEGTRPILVEIQALVCKTNFQLPRRTAAGTDYNRVNLLMAVIEKRMNLRMAECDAYINVAGGMKILEPALDLAIVAAILSSYKNRAYPGRVICFGEVGLTGEVRAVGQAGQRVMEAEKLGFEVCILPHSNLSSVSSKNVKLIGIRHVQELLQLL